MIFAPKKLATLAPKEDFLYIMHCNGSLADVSVYKCHSETCTVKYSKKYLTYHIILYI